MIAALPRASPPGVGAGPAPEADIVSYRRRILDAEECLDPGPFLRIHRSRVVNLRAIKEIVPSGNGDFVLTLQSGKQVESERSYRHHVVELLRGWGNGAHETA